MKIALSIDFYCPKKGNIHLRSNIESFFHKDRHFTERKIGLLLSQNALRELINHAIKMREKTNAEKIFLCIYRLNFIGCS